MDLTIPKAAAILKILFGGPTDAGFFYIGADGKIHHVPGWDPVNWAELSPETRDVLVCMGINELATAITDPKFKTEIQNIAVKGVKTRAERIEPAVQKAAA